MAGIEHMNQKISECCFFQSRFEGFHQSMRQIANEAHRVR